MGGVWGDFLNQVVRELVTVVLIIKGNVSKEQGATVSSMNILPYCLR